MSGGRCAGPCACWTQRDTRGERGYDGVAAVGMTDGGIGVMGFVVSANWLAGLLEGFGEGDFVAVGVLDVEVALAPGGVSWGEFGG